MPEDRSLRDVIFEYAVYVPIGIAASVVEQLPELTEKGRRLAGTRIHMARLMGEFAVGHAQRRFGRVLSSENSSADATEPGSGDDSGPPSRHGPESVAATDAPSPGLPPDMTPPTVSIGEIPAEAPPAATTGSASGPGRRSRRPAAPAPSQAAVVATSRAATDAAPVVESLAIPAYDTLAASQVVQRLSSLEPDELEAVRRYELGTRGRRTILHRVAQLNAAGGRSSS